MEENLKIPNHVAIILDGNGRWAKAKGMPRNYGHMQGAKTVEVICEEAYRMGIQYLTVYAFSTENWNRPQDEVDALMKLLRNYMKTCLKTAEKNRMCVRVLGDKTRLDEDIRTRIAELEEATKNNDGLHFQIAINYGGRDEIVRAVKKLSAKVQSGEVDPAGITADTLEGYLDTAGIPDPDLLIRTCNEQRISNFLLWQLAYTEFYFTPVPWPDFTKEELEKYKINRDAIIVNIKENVKLDNPSFDGINVNYFKIKVPDEYNEKFEEIGENFEFAKMYESILFKEEVQKTKLENVQERIKKDEIRISEIIGNNGTISEKELQKIHKQNLDKTRKLV